MEAKIRLEEKVLTVKQLIEELKKCDPLLEVFMESVDSDDTWHAPKEFSKVGKLIKKLRKYDPSLLVRTEGCDFS